MSSQVQSLGQEDLEKEMATRSWKIPWTGQGGGLQPTDGSQRAGLTLRNELSEETCAEKARDFIGKGYSGKEQQSKGTQENCSVV